MPFAKLLITKIVAKAVPVYTCVNCGAKGYGTDSVEREIGSGTVGQEPPITITVCNNFMPVGWAGYGLSAHHCPRCII